MSRITIRSATPEDAEEIARLHVDASLVAYRPIFGEDFRFGDISERVETWRRMLAQDPSLALTPPEKTYVACLEDGRIAGFCSIGPSRDEDAGDDGEVQMLYIAPDQWRAGVGRQLFESGVSYLKARGFSRLVLWVLKDNERARRFYERAGWRADGREKPSFNKPVLSQVRYTLAP